MIIQFKKISLCLENQDEFILIFIKFNININDFDYFGTLEIKLIEYINNKNGINLKILIEFNTYFKIKAYNFDINKKFNSSLP